MKYVNVIRISIGLIAVITASCSVEPSKVLAYQPYQTVQQAPVGEVVFDCYNVNHSWGYRLSGFFIDRTGQVYRYSRSGAPWQPRTVMQGKQIYYEATALLGKFTNKVLITSISAPVMQSKIALIDSAASGTVAYRRERVADAGTNGCTAYRFIADKNLYQPVELGSYGITQISTINNSSAAQALLQWLIAIRPTH